MPSTFLTLGLGAFARILLALALVGTAGAQDTLKILHDFGASGGYSPGGSLIFDGSGNLYGTTAYGPGTGCVGDMGCGEVFELQPNPNGAWNEQVIHQFDGLDGANPTAGVVFDRRGNLYGTTYNGGNSGYGTVFRMTPTSAGNWVLSTLYSFSPASGAYPAGALSFDPAGRLYGTATAGGPYSYGVAYSLRSLSIFGWYETLAHGFGMQGDGSTPYGNLIFDANANAYGTTELGGADNAGVVFALTPNPLSFAWTETVLHSFVGVSGCGQSGPDGVAPVAGLTFDSEGNLYGTTQCGGTRGRGTVFKLTHNGDGTWTESVLYSFQGGNDGANPAAPVIFDNAGNLYGTTCCGGPLTDGTIFRLSPSDGSWTETTLYTFSYGDGASPGPVIFGDDGNLYGITESGGSGGGTAFELILSPDR